MISIRTLTAILAFPAIAATSAAQAQEANRTTEMYHIFDLVTQAKRGEIIKALVDGLNINVSDSNTITPIVMGEAPEKAARMSFVSLSDNPNFAGLAALAGSTQAAMFKTVKCDGAVWIANAQRRIRRSQNLNLTFCLFPYVNGYNLDVYGLDTVEKGGGISEKLGRAIAGAVVGKPGDWTNKTIVDTLRKVRTTTPTTITYVEGQPEFTDTPWEDAAQVAPSAADKATVDTAPSPAPQ